MRYIGTISKYFHFPYEGMYSKSDIEYIEKTVTGNGYVDLLTAKSGSLSNLTLFGGTVQDDTDVIQSVVLDGATVQRNVPEGYTELDYIKNVMNSTKFNTGLSPQNGDVLELVRTAGSPTVSNYMFQSREGTQAGIYGISGSSTGGTIMGNRGSGQSIQSEILRANGHKYYTRLSVSGTTLTLTVRDLTDKLENTKTREIEDTVGGPSKYFLRGNATQAQAIGTAQNVYYASITTNGVERIKLIPAKQGDTVGFYDMVSQTFMSTFIGDTPVASSAEATAYPYAPMNIVGNNGAIKVHKNLADKTKLEKGDISSVTGEVNSGIKYRVVSDYIPILNGQTYTMSGTIYKINDDTPITPSGIFALYDSSKNYITGTRTVTTNTFTIDNASASYIRVERYPSGTDEVDLEKSEFQFQVGPNQTAYENGTGIYTEGQTETVQDALGNTATAEMLLKVSISNDYIDTQEVLTGAITRRIAIKVLDGTESWAVNSGDYNFFRLNNAVDFSGNLTTGFYCTHFVPASIASSSNNQGIRLNSNSIFLRFDSLYSATTENLPLFKQWLSEQYANGTPVIVVYPLTTPTTETVAGQELITKPITQTAGSISNMTITVTSDGGVPSPTTPKDIICNNGVVKVDYSEKFTSEGATTGYVLGSADGQLYENVEYAVTDYITLRAGKYKGEFTSTSSGSRYFRCWSYTQNGTPIEMIFNEKENGSTVNFTFTLATDSRVRLSYNFVRHSDLSIIPNAIIYTEGDVETVKDSSNRTATAEILLKVKDGADEQEVLSGNITRKNKILVLDGTEERTESGTSGTDDHRFMFKANSNNKSEFSVCTHISRILRSSTTSQSTRPCIRFSQDGINMFRYSADNTQTLADFKQRLAEQYANGTPVIVVYPLATETTETVTGQNLNVKSGTNKIEIVQASIDNLGMSATYLSRE